MSAAALTIVAAARSDKLLADVDALGRRAEETPDPPASERLEAVLGADLAERLVMALSSEPRR
jgi:hypothetical protein